MRQRDEIGPERREQLEGMTGRASVFDFLRSFFWRCVLVLIRFLFRVVSSSLARRVPVLCTLPVPSIFSPSSSNNREDTWGSEGFRPRHEEGDICIVVEAAG